MVPVAGRIIADLNGGQENKTGSILLVTIWELGEAAGPLLIAPLSERYGRYPVFNVANVLFIFGSLLGVLSQSMGLMIFARFFVGVTVASNVLNPAIIGDIFPSEQRGSAMSIVMFAPLLGGAIGPAISGAIAESYGWRATMWLSICLACVCETVILTCFRETYKITVLAKKGISLSDNSESPIPEDLGLLASITRPLKVYWSSFVLQILSLYGALVFTFFYVMSTTLPDILRYRYNFTPAMVGSAFLSFSVGSVIGLAVCHVLLDRIYKALQSPDSGKSQPENRLPLVIVSSIILPFVVALYGWVAQCILPVPLMLLAVVLLGAFVIMGMVPLTAYVVDSFNIFSASAMTAVLITRCLMGTFLPLVTAPLSEAIGYGLGFTVLAAATLLLAPVPFVIRRYGGQWRQKSDFTKDE